MYLHLLYLNNNNFREKNRGGSGLGGLERVPIITAFDSSYGYLVLGGHSPLPQVSD